jgi:hypothetical protein
VGRRRKEFRKFRNESETLINNFPPNDLGRHATTCVKVPSALVPLDGARKTRRKKSEDKHLKKAGKTVSCGFCV